jgi:hypothetical protein
MAEVAMALGLGLLFALGLVLLTALLFWFFEK